MRAIAIEGTTRVLGKQQGYLGLHVKDSELADGTPFMVTAWEPSAEELEALNKGASIHLIVLGNQHPPVKMEVGVLPEEAENG